MLNEGFVQFLLELKIQCFLMKAFKKNTLQTLSPCFLLNSKLLGSVVVPGQVNKFLRYILAERYKQQARQHENTVPFPAVGVLV